MKSLITGLCGLFVVGCAASTPEGTALSDGSLSYTVTCEKDWSSCYGAARKICGGNNFEELDRMADATVMSGGQLAHRSTQDSGHENPVYTQVSREEAFRRVLTIRCTSD